MISSRSVADEAAVTTRSSASRSSDRKAVALTNPLSAPSFPTVRASIPSGMKLPAAALAHKPLSLLVACGHEIELGAEPELAEPPCPVVVDAVRLAPRLWLGVELRRRLEPETV